MNEWIVIAVMVTALIAWTMDKMQLAAYRKQLNAERDAWAKERKDLLDRIQAPTFAQYTHKVIAEKKAEQPKEEEENVEFVS